MRKQQLVVILQEKESFFAVMERLSLSLTLHRLLRSTSFFALHISV